MLWSPCNYSNIIQRSYTLLLINKDHFLFLLLLVNDYFCCGYRGRGLQVPWYCPSRQSGSPMGRVETKWSIDRICPIGPISPISIENMEYGGSESNWSRTCYFDWMLFRFWISEYWRLLTLADLFDCNFFASKTKRWFSVKFIQKIKLYI